MMAKNSYLHTSIFNLQKHYGMLNWHHTLQQQKRRYPR